jgi:hypothetical protein
MFYSNGNYEAFIRPRKPQGVDEKSAYLIGGGIASLAAAGFLIRWMANASPSTRQARSPAAAWKEIVIPIPHSNNSVTKTNMHPSIDCQKVLN